MKSFKQLLSEAKYKPQYASKDEIELLADALDIDTEMPDKAKELRKKGYFTYKKSEMEDIAFGIDGYINRHVLEDDENDFLYDVVNDFGGA